MAESISGTRVWSLLGFNVSTPRCRQIRYGSVGNIPIIKAADFRHAAPSNAPGREVKGPDSVTACLPVLNPSTSFVALVFVAAPTRVPASATNVFHALLGLQCPALPLHWHLKLGFGTFAVDLVFGSQFAAAMVLRLWAFAPPEY